MLLLSSAERWLNMTIWKDDMIHRLTNQHEIVLNEKNHSQEALTLALRTMERTTQRNRISIHWKMAELTSIHRPVQICRMGTLTISGRNEEPNPSHAAIHLGVGYADEKYIKEVMHYRYFHRPEWCYGTSSQRRCAGCDTTEIILTGTSDAPFIGEAALTDGVEARTSLMSADNG